LAKINHLNAKKTDAFMAALLESRSDLAGLPFQMGGACRTSGEQMKQVKIAVGAVRSALRSNATAENIATVGNGSVMASGDVNANAGSPTFLWSQITSIFEQQDNARTRQDRELNEHVVLGRIAALTQMLAAETPEVRIRLVKYLTGVPHIEATKALARLATFSAQDDVRQAAIDSLKVRREKGYTDILVKGLSYPWPAVAKNSADAIAKMGRADLIPNLITMLESPDPRLPIAKSAAGHKAEVVRELVKVNHPRNCMMCHALGPTRCRRA